MAIKKQVEDNEETSNCDDIIYNVQDRKNFCLILIFIIGIGSVLPFNILMNATTFFSEKLDYKKVEDDDVKDATKSFSVFIGSYLGVASTLPNLLLQFYNSISKSSSGTVKTKLLYSIIVQIVCFALIIGTVYIDAIGHPYLFFFSILSLAFVINSAGGLYQNLSFVLAANLPMAYTNANVTGSNVGGIISALAAILSMLLTDNKQYSSILFFVIAIIFVSIQLLTTNALFKNEYYLANLPNNNDQDNQSNNRSTQELTNSIQNKKNDLLIVFKECWNQLLNIFLTFYISLLIFPAVQINIKSVNNQIQPGFFIALFTFLNFNLFATIGNAVTFWKSFPLVSKDKLWIFVLIRLLFIPFFMFCNYLPNDRSYRVIFESDLVYVIGGALLGFTSGYFSSLGLMYAPRSVSKPEYAETAAKMGAFALITGIFLGVSSSFFFHYLV